MTRTHGRCARGERLVAKAPFGKWRTLTFLAALRCDGLTAPCVIDGPINGASFRAYVEQVLAPILAPRDVWMDARLPQKETDARHRTRARQLERARGLHQVTVDKRFPPTSRIFRRTRSFPATSTGAFPIFCLRIWSWRRSRSPCTASSAWRIRFISCSVRIVVSPWRSTMRRESRCWRQMGGSTRPCRWGGTARWRCPPKGGVVIYAMRPA
jgi:hypothetical protein